MAAALSSIVITPVCISQSFAYINAAGRPSDALCGDHALSASDGEAN
ncbi:MAG: hypothetical protein AAFO79_09700 [Pseudomonadota bacterium]